MSTAELHQQREQGTCSDQQGETGDKPPEWVSRGAPPAPERVPGAVALTPAQRRLLAEVAHELRTPIQGIAGLAEFALGRRLQPTLRETFELVRGAAEELLAMTNDILDHARAETGHLEIHRAPFGLRGCLSGAMGVMSAVARDKGLQLAWHVAPELPDRLIGDACRLRQVLLNLAGNGIKYSDQGSVEILVSTALREGDRICCRFDVRDCGSGIPPEQLEEIFKPFHQGEGVAASHHGGVGLGLAIARQLVESMDGHLWVDSVLGEGSTFHFTAWFHVPPSEAEDRSDREPVAAVSGKPESPPAHLHAEKALKILLAEDVALNRRMAERDLQAAGHQVVCAENGALALAALSATDFDLALLDVQMPGLSGLEIIRRIRARERSTKARRPYLPVVVMTAHDDPVMHQLCLAAGADACLAKPVSADALCRMVARIACVGSEAAMEGETAVDAPALLERVDHDKAFLREIILSFRSSGERHLRQAMSALGLDRKDELAQALHALGGMLASVAAGALARQAARLERLALAGASQEMAPLLDDFTCNVQQVEKQLIQLGKAQGLWQRSGAGKKPAAKPVRRPAAQRELPQQEGLCLQL